MSIPARSVFLLSISTLCGPKQINAQTSQRPRLHFGPGHKFVRGHLRLAEYPYMSSEDGFIYRTRGQLLNRHTAFKSSKCNQTKVRHGYLCRYVSPSFKRRQVQRTHQDSLVRRQADTLIKYSGCMVLVASHWHPIHPIHPSCPSQRGQPSHAFLLPP